jgi:hypothetical protein
MLKRHVADKELGASCLMCHGWGCSNGPDKQVHCLYFAFVRCGISEPCVVSYWTASVYLGMKERLCRLPARFCLVPLGLVLDFIKLETGCLLTLQTVILLFLVRYGSKQMMSWSCVRVCNSPSANITFSCIHFRIDSDLELVIESRRYSSRYNFVSTTDSNGSAP